MAEAGFWACFLGCLQRYRFAGSHATAGGRVQGEQGFAAAKGRGRQGFLPILEKIKKIKKILKKHEKKG